MRRCLLLLLLALPALAQEPGGTPPPPPPTLPVRAGDSGVFLLASGRTIAGTVQGADAARVIISYADDIALELPAARVIGRLGPLPGLPGDGARRPEDVRVVTANGIRHGTLLERTGGSIRLRGPDGQVFEVALAEALELGFVADDVARRREALDPGRFRHVFVPSAVGLRQKECTVSANGFAPLALRCGMASWLTGSAGLSLPVVFGSELPPLGLEAGLTLHAPPLGGLRGAAGASLLTSRRNTLAFLHAELGYATRSSSSTVYLGPAPRLASRLAELDAVVAGAAHSQRLTRRFTAVVEAWASRRASRLQAVGAAALRLHQGRLALDLGVLGGSRTAAPWVAFTFDGSEVSP